MPTVMITSESYVQVAGPWVRHLQDAGFDVAYPEDRTFTRGHTGEDDTVRVLSQASAVIAGGEYLTAVVLARLPKLRVIARSGVGYDRVDVAAATAHGIALTVTPTANHESVAEHALALIFALSKSVIVNDAHARAGRWPKAVTEPIRGKTLGILGLGRIGRSLAVRGRGMAMSVIATEKYPDQEFVRQHGIELVDFDTLLSRSDILSIHCPLNAETRGLFNADVLGRMKQGSFLVNTARGGVVVEADLLKVLKNGPLRGAGLDVFEQEPVSADNPLFQLPNVVVSPHIASSDWLSQENMAIEAADSIIRLHRGEWPRGAVVNDQLKNGWKW